MSSSQTPPPGPGQPPGGRPPAGLPPGAVPADALPPDGLPPLPMSGEAPGPDSGTIRMKEMPRMNAKPYIKRAFKLLAPHKPMVALSLFLSLIMILLPFVAAAVFWSPDETLCQGCGQGWWRRLERSLGGYRLVL